MPEAFPRPLEEHGQRVGVVGGGGFIGRTLVASLRAQGHEVQRLGRGNRVDGPLDVLVFAQGGRSAAGEALDEAHVRTTERLLESVRPSTTVYLSSGECYGALPVPFREDSPLEGSSPYALAKLRGEALVRGFPGTKAHVLRLAVVYGLGQTGTMLLPSLIESVSRGEDVELTAGEQSRDFVHVDDVAALVVACIERPSAGTFNCGSGVEIEGRAVALEVLWLFDALGSGRKRGRVLLGALSYREREQMRYLLDCSAACSTFDWAPRRALFTALEEWVSAAVGP